MLALLGFLLALLSLPCKSKSRLEADSAVLRRQLIVLQRKVGGRVHFTNSERLFFIQPYRWFLSVLKAITVIRPEILVRWHRAGFRRYWRWKSRFLGGRPQIAAGLRALIRRMSIENPCGAPHVSMASCSSSASKSLNQASPSTWSSSAALGQKIEAEEGNVPVRRSLVGRCAAIGMMQRRSAGLPMSVLGYCECISKKQA